MFTTIPNSCIILIISFLDSLPSLIAPLWQAILKPYKLFFSLFDKYKTCSHSLLLLKEILDFSIRKWQSLCITDSLHWTSETRNIVHQLYFNKNLKNYLLGHRPNLSCSFCLFRFPSWTLIFYLHKLFYLLVLLAYDTFSVPNPYLHLLFQEDTPCVSFLSYPYLV